MEPIRSGTTTERLVRTTVPVVAVIGFAAAFLWDGMVGYPRESASQLAASLGMPAEPAPAYDPELTVDVARQLIAEIPPGAASAAIAAKLGEPTFTFGDAAFYLGPAGYIRATLQREKLKAIEWVDGIHTETDLILQQWLGGILAVMGMVLLVQFGRVATTRVELTEAGLKIRGKSPIPFEAMTAIQADHLKTHGYCVLEYTRGNRKDVVRLDGYIIRRRDEIVRAICEKTGFPIPDTLK